MATDDEVMLNPKNEYFQLLDDTLKKLGIFDNPEQKKLCPDQFFADSIIDFVDQLMKYVDAKGLIDRPVVLFVDDTPKKISGSVKVADDVVYDALRLVRLKVKKVSVPKLVNRDWRTIHAEWEVLPILQKFCADNKDAVFIIFAKGAIVDMVKHAIFLEKLESLCIVIPPALTVTAFTSAYSVLDRAGAKNTYPSLCPSATFWLYSLVSAAPVFLTRSGYGDLLSAFVAQADWYLGYKLGIMEEYTEIGYQMMEPYREPLKEIAPLLAQEALPLNAVACTSAALAMAGMAMNVAGATTPMSGFEHVISHALDYLRIQSHRPPGSHGLQVAVATLTSAACWDWLLAQDTFDPATLMAIDEKKAHALINKRLFTAPYHRPEEDGFDIETEWDVVQSIDQASDIYAKNYCAKLRKWLDFKQHHFNDFLKEWPEIRKKLRALTMTQDEVRRILVVSGLPVIPADLNPPVTRVEFHWVVRMANFIRNRFSAADLFFWLKKDPIHISAGVRSYGREVAVLPSSAPKVLLNNFGSIRITSEQAVAEHH